MKQGNIDVIVLQEINLTKGIHIHYGAGYEVWAMKEESRHRGGFPVVWREEAGW